MRTICKEATGNDLQGVSSLCDARDGGRRLCGGGRLEEGLDTLEGVEEGAGDDAAEGPGHHRVHVTRPHGRTGSLEGGATDGWGRLEEGGGGAHVWVRV